jgi:hypothetical protein
VDDPLELGGVQTERVDAKPGRRGRKRAEERVGFVAELIAHPLYEGRRERQRDHRFRRRLPSRIRWECHGPRRSFVLG